MLKTAKEDDRIVRAILAEFVFNHKTIYGIELESWNNCSYWKKEPKIEYGKWTLLPNYDDNICYVMER